MSGAVCIYVITDKSESVAGANVRGHEASSGWAVGKSWTSGFQPSLQVEGDTDQSGRVLFDNLQPGQWVFLARSRDGQILGETTVHVLPDALGNVTIAGTGSAPVVRQEAAQVRSDETPDPVTLAKAVSGGIRGRVIRMPEEVPLADAAVSIVRGPSPAPDIAAVTDSSGNFVFDNLTEGTWRVRALGPEGESGEAEVFVGETAQAECTIEVPAGHRVDEN